MPSHHQVSSVNKPCTIGVVMHTLCWIAGVLALTLPFFQYWPIKQGEFVFYLRQGAGFFGDNMLILFALSITGAMLGGVWWHFMLRHKGGATTSLRVFGLAFISMALLALNPSWSKACLLYAIPAVLISGVLYTFFTRYDKNLRFLALGSVKRLLRQKFPWNGVFFALLFVLLLINNTMALIGTGNSAAEIASAILGRAFFYLAIMAWLTVVVYALQHVTPAILRWIPWLVWGVLPWLVVLDSWLVAAVGRPIRGFANGMTASGKFDLVTELQAGGINGINEVGFLCLFALFLLLSALCIYAQSRSSAKLGLKMSGLRILVFGALMTALAIAEQGVGSKWKYVNAWQQEHKALVMHLGVFTPPRGVGSFKVEFYANADADVREAVATTKPDIYVIMVESMRADAISEKVTPFLAQFASNESQQLGSTWSGSNATHLSWFSMMHSQVPIHWRSTLEAVTDRENYKGPAGLKWLKNAGYNLEVRAVCDLGYKDFGLLNFGAGTTLVDVLEQSLDGTEFSTHNIPEREVITFDRLYASLKSNPEGGNFYYTALDSPHYGYYWHSDFTPPFADYISDASFPVRPSEDEVQLYWQRYLNSCAWVDHQIEEFCAKLKKEGRYDNAIIVITGDHGEEFQERGRWCHCSSVFPEQTQVPLFIKWPKSVGRGPTKSVASHLDVMPSLLAYLGAPSEVTGQMAGHNLLSGDEHSVITTTSYAGTSGETMVLRRGDYAAYFSWPRYWLANVPERISLEYIEHKGEKVMLESPEAYLEELRTIFPDAFDRFIKKMDVIES